MMTWTAALDNPQAILSLFESIGELSLVDLHEVTVNREGPLLRLRFDVGLVPKTLPDRWTENSNTTQITLAAWGITSLQIEGWNTSVCGSLSVSRENAICCLSFLGEACSINANCTSVRIESIRGYVKGG